MHGGCDRDRDGDVMRRGEGGGGEVVDQETATHVTQLRIIFHERGLAFLLQYRIVVWTYQEIRSRLISTSDNIFMRDTCSWP